MLPEDAPEALAEVLKAVARRTGQLCAGESMLAEVIAGRIVEVHEEYVVRVRGSVLMVPRWMAVAARRDKVGELFALVMDWLDDASVVVEAVPAIDVEDDAGAGAFSPFGRGEVRVRNLTQAHSGGRAAAGR